MKLKNNFLVTYNKMRTLLFFTLSTLLLGVQGINLLNNCFKKNSLPISSIPIYDEDYSMNDGEVPWDFPSNIVDEDEPIIHKQRIPPQTSKELDKEKLWKEVNNNYVKPVLSGVFKVMYYQSISPDNIINDIQNINCNFCISNNKINSASEVDLIINIVTIITYNTNIKNTISEITYIHSNESSTSYKISNIKQYLRIKKSATLMVVLILTIFAKNVQSAT